MYLPWLLKWDIVQLYFVWVCFILSCVLLNSSLCQSEAFTASMKLWDSLMVRKLFNITISSIYWSINGLISGDATPCVCLPPRIRQFYVDQSVLNRCTFLLYFCVHMLYVPYLSVLKPGSYTRRGSNIRRVVQQNTRFARLLWVIYHI